MLTSDFDYDLPRELIAQIPLTDRDASRLMIINRGSKTILQSHFHSIGDFLNPGDVLVLNESRVIPARLYGKKMPHGGRIELLFLRERKELEWEVWVGGKGLIPGVRLDMEGGLQADIFEQLEGARRIIRVDRSVIPHLEKYGRPPLPPYIHTDLAEPGRYQTVYADPYGSAAAPTAGLHFTPRLINKLKTRGIKFVWITLHIGLDTFAPVNEENPADHKIHSEWCCLPNEAAEIINQAHLHEKRIVAVGTTSVRTLETAALQAKGSEIVGPFQGNTNLFILPGFQFRVVDAMITNFHLPKSTLIMLVSAFAGRDLILDAYELAIQEKYRFYSFGDAMLVI